MNIMYILTIILSLFLIGCAGSDGESGKNGRDGTDNRFIYSVTCTGTLYGGYWDSTKVFYTAMYTTTKDVLVTASVHNLGSFNNTATEFYSHKQYGSNIAAVLVMIDNYNYADISVEDGNVKVEIVSTNGHSEVYDNMNACELKKF